MKAYVFPGQGAQSPGMGSDLYAGQKALFDQANDILGFNLSDIMFNGSMEDLTQTKVTQPAVFLHSIAKAVDATACKSCCDVRTSTNCCRSQLCQSIGRGS